MVIYQLQYGILQVTRSNLWNIHSKKRSMKNIPKGVKYIPRMVHTAGMLCKHTNNGMLCIPLHGMY